MPSPVSGHQAERPTTYESHFGPPPQHDRPPNLRAEEGAPHATPRPGRTPLPFLKERHLQGHPLILCADENEAMLYLAHVHIPFHMYNSPRALHAQLPTPYVRPHILRTLPLPLHHARERE